MKDNYFIDLLLDKCINLKKTKSIFISYNTYNEAFIQKLLERLKNYKIKDIYLDCIDPFFEHDLLKKLSIKEMKKCKYFDASIYNKYAKKKAAFLMFVSPHPELFSDIDPEKLALATKLKSDSKKYFVDKEMKSEISWSIIPLYNEYWEKSLKINNLQDILYDICLVDKNVINNWNKELLKATIRKKKLEKYQFEYLIFRNEKGTNLKVGLTKNYEFETAADSKILANLPSYEIFTSPNFKKTSGKVYSSKPLYYSGSVIEDFYLEFKNGKVVDYDAKKGKKLLKSIIDYDKTSAFLGEVALVEEDSPISKTNIIFKTTLLDENASCHLALGRGFGKESKRKLIKKGVNISSIHVDFMIGTKDIQVIGIKGKKEVKIMENGKFVLE